jgi:RNA polymerase sigma-70 factor, ECF subfamily
LVPAYGYIACAVPAALQWERGNLDANLNANLNGRCGMVEAETICANLLGCGHKALRGAPPLMSMSSPEPKRLPSTIVRDDEGALVSLAKKGDLKAFDELVNRYETRIFRLAMNITQNREDAEDATQDAFMKSFQHLPDFQGGSRFYTWLVRIAVNEALMRLRRRRPNVTSLDEPIQTDEDLMPREIRDWGPTPEKRYEVTELNSILSNAIAELDPIFRTVFILRDVEDLSTEETAEALGISVPAVKSRLLRGRLKLREKLSPSFERSKPA